MSERSLDEIAEQLSASLLAPLSAVGELLARELDALKTEVSEIRQHLSGLQDRVSGIEHQLDES